MGSITLPTNMDTEKFNLMRNEFESCASGAIKNLFSDKNFTGVTLACDDDKQIAAHKVVLSACSPFFQRILLNNPHQHPLIFLKGMRYDDLQSVMQFIYLGETEVGQDDLQTFLAAAKDLEIKGLSDNEIEHSLAPTKLKVGSYNLVDKGTMEKYDRQKLGKDNIKTEESLEMPFIEDFDNNRSSSMLLCEDLPSTRNEKGKYPCDQCEYQASHVSELSRHKQAKHEGVKLQCDFCERAFSFKSNLNRHQKKAHSGID